MRKNESVCCPLARKKQFLYKFCCYFANRQLKEHSVKVLVVEDNKQLIEDLSEFLANNGFVVEQAQSFAEAADKTAIYQYDMVLIDLGLPDGNGLDLIPIIRQDRPDTSILMLTANDGVDYKVKALEWGADDYLTKPFGPRELVARVRAVLRRANVRVEDEGPHRVVFGELTIDPSRHEVVRSGELVDLTATEFRLLHFLASHPGKVFSRQRLVKEAIGEDAYILERNIDVHVRAIRKKLGDDADYISTVRGVGYRFRDIEDA